MKKTKYLLLSLLFCGAFWACSDDKDVTENIPEPEDPEEIKALDLSEPGMANCYIVQKPGLYKFKADNMFNLGEGLPVPREISPVSARLLWQSEKGLVDGIELRLEDNIPYVNFEVKSAKGNLLIGVCDEDENIVWSWHIWMPAQDIEGIYTSTGYEVMNMNLGAINNTPGDYKAYGMLYQWGRKDPFPAAGTLTGTTSTLSAPMYDLENNEVFLTNSSWTDNTNNTVSYAVAHPMEVLSNYSQFGSSRDWLKSGESDDSLWGNPNGEERDAQNRIVNKGRKTCYDPSPLGWRVPPSDVFKDFTISGGYTWTEEDFNIADINGDGDKTLDDYNYGWCFMLNSEKSSYFPAASRFDGSYAMLMGSMSGLWGNYWSNTPYSEITGGAYCSLAFQVKDMMGQEVVSVSPSAGSSRADAFSIRCIRDE